MNLHFEPITSENRATALNLKIAGSQHGFIESVEQCLSEADRCKRWHPVGIYDGDTMVGFAMYGFFLWQYLPFGRLWMDRLLIDEKYQGKGYGTAAFSVLLIVLLLHEPQSRSLCNRQGKHNRFCLASQSGLIHDSPHNAAFIFAFSHNEDHFLFRSQ